MQNEKNKIVGFSQDDLSLINNGNKDTIKNISNPNRVGHVEDPQGNVISDITPLIMVINSAGQDWREIVQAMVAAGANLDMPIENYYGRNTNAREIANKYRNGL